ncbi:serine carboxypeptidase-like protein [Tanacetum coccineum]
MVFQYSLKPIATNLHDVSNIIFLDQPTRTGFSYSSSDQDTCHDETGVSNDLYKFLQYYDIRKKCDGNLCYDFSEVKKFLNETSVKTTLGVPSSIQFVSCNHTVYEAMIDDWIGNLEIGIPALLEQNIQFLVYAGEYDLICNWLEAEVLKNHGPLTFLKVHNAGHLVPMDQPDAALKMLEF